MVGNYKSIKILALVIALVLIFTCYKVLVPSVGKAIQAFPMAAIVEGDSKAQQQMQEEIKKLDSVKDVQVKFGQHGLIYDPSGQQKPNMKNYMSVAVFLDQVPAPKMEVRIAKIIIEKYPLAKRYDILTIALFPQNGAYLILHAPPKHWQDEVDALKVQ